MILDQPLGWPWFYTLTQFLWYKRGEQEAYVKAWVKPRPGDRLLDIGCGLGKLLDFLPDVHYVGFDPNPRYIASAQKHYGTRGRFHQGYLYEIPEDEVGIYDIVLANGVLHHVTDAEAEALIGLAHKALKPKGRMVTRDGVFEKNQNRFAKFLLESDRGHYVRTQPHYESLLLQRFGLLRTEILRQSLRLPYSMIHFEVIKNA